MLQRIKKRFDIDITESGAVHSKTFELDKNITAIHGLLFTSDKDDLMYYRGSQKVEINRQEVFPEGYETKLLMSGLNVSPNDRFYELGGVEPGNGKVKVDFKDTNDERIPFAQYRVTLYLDCAVNDQI
jgi:hypothetical protein